MNGHEIIPGSRWADDAACQDRSAAGLESIGDIALSWATVADGVGSHDGSQFGAELAVRVVELAFCLLAERLSPPIVPTADTTPPPTVASVEAAVRELVADIPRRIAAVADLVSCDYRESERPLAATLLIAVVVGTDADEEPTDWAAAWICGDGIVAIGVSEGTSTTTNYRGEVVTAEGAGLAVMEDDMGRLVPCTTIDLILEGRGVPKRMSGPRRGSGLRLAAEARGSIIGVMAATDGLRHHEQLRPMVLDMLRGDGVATENVMSGAWMEAASKVVTDAKAAGSYVDDLGIAWALR